METATLIRTNQISTRVLTRGIVRALVYIGASFVVSIQNVSRWTQALIAARSVCACVLTEFVWFCCAFIDILAEFAIILQLITRNARTCEAAFIISTQLLTLVVAKAFIDVITSQPVVKEIVTIVTGTIVTTWEVMTLVTTVAVVHPTFIYI